MLLAAERAVLPSVVLITLDTVRADHLGCYGYKQIETPAIDRLAAEGIRFANAYAQAPITLPSHAVILTGTYPMFNGVRDFTSARLRGDIPTLAEILRRRGYATAAFVSSFVLNSMFGLNRGFETYDDNVGYDPGDAQTPFLLERRGDRTVDRALEWLDARARKPFFLWLHLYDPHSPYHPPEPYRRRYASHPYDGEIAFADAQVARVIARLRSLRLYQNTLIALLSDHGESLGEHGEDEHGFFVYNSTLRVPLIFKLPDNSATKPQVVQQPVATVDIAPTIAQVCQIPSQNTRHFQGHSLLDAFKQPATDRRIYGESCYPRNSFGWHELHTLVTADFQYVETLRSELYDLRGDPGERRNVIGEHAALAASFHEALEAIERQLENPRATDAAKSLDPETLGKLRSLGYIPYKPQSAEGSQGVLRADPKDKIGTLNQILRAADLTRLARYEDAEGLLEGLERAEPDLYIIPFQRGENFLAWGRPQEAIAEFRKSLWREPTFDQAALGLGRAYFLTGQDADASKALELALRLSPYNFLARTVLAKVYWRQNELRKAEAELAQVVQSHPAFAEGHADYGVVLAKLGKYTLALSEIRRGIGLGYGDAIAYNYLGIAYAQSGDVSEAIRAYQKAVELNPNYAAAYINLAVHYRRQRQFPKAQQYYERVCKLSEELCRQYASQFPAAKP